MAQDTITTRHVITAEGSQALSVFRSVGAEFGKLQTAAVSLRGALAALPVAVAAAGIANSFRGALELGDQLNKLSQKVGISVEKLSELKHAADLSDVSLETFTTGMRGLNDTLTKATDATSKEAKLLRELGVTAKDPEKALGQLADAFQKLPDGATKSATAVAVLGRAGLEMVPFLNQGASGLNAMGESARKLGSTFTGEVARAAEQFNDNMRTLRISVDALGISLTSKLVKSMADYSTQLVKAREEGRLWVRVLEDGLRVGLRVAESVPGLGQFARLGSAALAARAQAERESVARRTATGTIRGVQPEGGDPDHEARLACTLAGGTWDAKAGRCVPRAGGTGPKPISSQELLARSSAKAEEVGLQAEDDATRKHGEFLNLLAQNAQKRAEIQQQQSDAAEEAAKKLREEADAWRELLEPSLKYLKQIQEIDKLEANGNLNAAEAAELRERISKAAQDAALDMRALGIETKNTDDLAKRLGLTFTSALEDAIVRGGKLSDTLKALGQDIARVLVRTKITEPLLKDLVGTDKEPGLLSNVGSSIGSWLADFGKRLVSFAGGGVMTAYGAMPLRRYAAGGVATSPQLAMFGEGSRPEAFVPLPDGRSIPVKMQGGAGITVVQHNTFAPGSEAAMRQVVYSMMPEIQRVTTAGVVDAQRRGMLRGVF